MFHLQRLLANLLFRTMKHREYFKFMEKNDKSKVPTIGAVNTALAKMNVSKNHPSQTIDLGNGFTVKGEVGASPIGSGAPINLSKIMNPNGMTMQPLTIYAVHAKAYFEVDTFYVKEFGISISDDYSYDNSKHVITKYQNPPSASATANLGWYGSITDKSVQTYDKTAADAIADADYKYINAFGNYDGHIELRFTGTGNYYMHDTHIGGSEY
jgi:hypothetical protein